MRILKNSTSVLRIEVITGKKIPEQLKMKHWTSYELRPFVMFPLKHFWQNMIHMASLKIGCYVEVNLSDSVWFFRFQTQPNSPIDLLRLLSVWQKRQAFICNRTSHQVILTESNNADRFESGNSNSLLPHRSSSFLEKIKGFKNYVHQLNVKNTR